MILSARSTVRLPPHPNSVSPLPREHRNRSQLTPEFTRSRLFLARRILHGDSLAEELVAAGKCFLCWMDLNSHIIVNAIRSCSDPAATIEFVAAFAPLVKSESSRPD